MDENENMERETKMKIYAVTKGHYSDYHICALTVDKDEAERFKRAYTDSFDEAQIEEYEDCESKVSLSIF